MTDETRAPLATEKAQIEPCVFCGIVDGSEPAEFVEQGPTHVAFVPLNPQVPGHVLFVPRQHVSDATESPLASANVMYVASRYAQSVGPCNIITSVGAVATQSVFHLHVHVLPRSSEDGLRPSWPWVRPVVTPPGQPPAPTTPTDAAGGERGGL